MIAKKDSILIAGDLSLQSRATKCLWNFNSIERAFCGVKQLAAICQHAIVNLESPVTSSSKRIIKDGPSLKNTSEVFKIINYCGFDIVTLANNHLKDYGSQGVLDTIDYCEKNGLQFIGAGDNLCNARKALILESNDVKIGVLNVCEHESSIATRTKAGSNPLDFVYLYRDILSLRKQVDKVIVIIHGGREHYQLPTPRMKREYRLIADFGADVIVNHHQHCFSGYEIYNGKPIFYGLGNFFFDHPHKRNDKWNYGMLLKLDIKKDSINFQMIPYEQCNEEAIIKILDINDFQENLENLNTIIADDVLLENAFNELVSSIRPLYPFLPFGNKYYRFLYHHGILPAFISKKNKANIENAISCETHRELFMYYFKKQIHQE